MGINRNIEDNSNMRVSIQPNIGLDSDVRQSVVEILNQILADETVLMIKTRSAYWNVSGVDFFQMRIFHNTQVNHLNDISNDIAERVRMLGGFALGGLGEILVHSRLVERPGEVPDVLHLLADHEAIIRFFREDNQKCSEEYEDEGTSDLLVRIMRMHEKTAWILRSITETEPLRGKNLVITSLHTPAVLRVASPRETS